MIHQEKKPMKKQLLGKSDLNVSRIGYGAMYIGGSWDDTPLAESTREQASQIVHTALDAGINFFDHADIYCKGKSEKAFAEVWKNSSDLRQKIYLQTKCGIRFETPHRFDFSYEHIMASVEGSLKRLETDYLDVLLLHRPDPLVEPEEVAHAFDELHRAGKVRWFGVSNHTAAQMELLQKYLDQPIVTDQVQFSLIHTHLLDEGIVFNQDNPRLSRNAGTIEYCRMNNITLQAWGPLGQGRIKNNPGPNESAQIHKTITFLEEMATKKMVRLETILIAWILRHPALIQPLPGTTNPERLRACCEADDISLSREEWYSLFLVGRGESLP
jgi:predicted oxidoreductase